MNSGLSPSLVPLLARSTALAELDDEGRSALAAEMEEVHLEAGETLIHQGERGEHLFVLLQGHLVAVQKREGEGGDQILREMVPGDLVGEVALITGGERTATVRADQSSLVASLSRDGLDQLLARRPEAAMLLTEMIAQRLRRSQLATHLSRLFGLLDLAALRDLEDSVEWVRLESGRMLFRQGDQADAAYVVISGRVRVTVNDRGEEKAIGEVGRGETVGEIALLTHGVRSASIHAIRDTELARFTQEAFDRLTEKYPGAMTQMTRIIGTRLQRMTLRGPSRARGLDTLAVVPHGPDDPVDEFCDQLIQALRLWGTVRLLTAEDVDRELGREGIARVSADDPAAIRLTQWLSEQESQWDYVIYRADRRWSAWTERAASQADHILIVADPRSDPRRGEIETLMVDKWSSLRAPGRSLVLVHNRHTSEPSGTAAWLDHREVRHHYHVREDRQADYERLARILTGHANGLVLGGGGARGFAHIGVFRALEELGIPIDMVGGTSMGAIVAGQIAMGRSAAQTLSSSREYFADLFDYTFPMVSMLTGGKIMRQLRIGFGSRHIEDFWMPFFCISTNLTRAEQVVDRRGDAALATRTSISLPGVMPPIYRDGDLLIDGGLLNNVPTDVMRSLNPGGKLIAVDVTPAIDLRSGTPFPPELSGWSLLARRVWPFSRRYEIPHILSLLNRATILASVSSRNRALTDEIADLYLQLAVDRWGMLEFQAIDEIAEHGYRLSLPRLQEWIDPGRALEET